MARAGWSQAPDDDAADDVPGGDGAARGGRLRAVRDLERRAAGRESRHNLKYWTDGEWLGFGCGAHSTRGGVRWKNVSATEDYIAARRGRPSRWRSNAAAVGARAARGGALHRPAACRRRRRRGGRGAVRARRWGRFGPALVPFITGGIVRRGRPHPPDARRHAGGERSDGGVRVS